MQKFMCYCTVFALFYCEFEGNFRVQTPRGLYLQGPVTYRRVFRVTSLGGHIFGGAHTCRGLFSEPIQFKLNPK